MSGVTLVGNLLVALPALYDPNFDRTVILVLEHGDEGALGVVLNRPTDVRLDEPLPAWGPLAVEPAVVFVGGPVGADTAMALAASPTPAWVEREGWAPLGVGGVGTVD